MMSGVSAFLWQAALMLLAAYFIGAFIGCWLRRRFSSPPKVAMEAELGTGPEAVIGPRSEEASATSAAASVSTVAASPTVREEQVAGAMGDAAARVAAAPEPIETQADTQSETVPVPSPPAAAPSAPPVATEPKRFTPPMTAAAAAAAALAARQAAAKAATAKTAAEAAANLPTTTADTPAPSAISSTTDLPSATGSSGQAVVAAQVSSDETPASTQPDELTMIAGVTPADMQSLRDAGYKTFAAIAAWSAADVAKMNAIIGNRRISRENWIEQAHLLQSGAGTVFSKGARPELAPRPEAMPTARRITPAPANNDSVITDTKPDVSVRAAFSRERRGYADDLQQIDGINAEVEKLLNEQGVTRIAQIAGWPLEEQQRIDRLLGGMNRVSREDWVSQARRISGFADPAPQPDEPKSEETKPAEPAPDISPPSAAPVAITLAPEAAPIDISHIVPADSDNNSAAPPKIDPQQEAEPSSNVSLLGNAPAQASPVRGLRSVRSEALVGANTVDNNGIEDDLKHIRGIGVLLEKRLRAMGYTSYAQIGSWTQSDVDRVNQQLDFRGRIERENWIEQARILAAGGQTDFSRRQERGED